MFVLRKINPVNINSRITPRKSIHRNYSVYRSEGHHTPGDDWKCIEPCNGGTQVLFQDLFH
jgi:hypothetical protein